MCTRGTVLSGRLLSQIFLQRIKAEVAFLTSEYNVFPKLAVIQVGDLNESTLFIECKQRAAVRCGIALSHVRLPCSCKEDTLLELVYRLNADPTVHGIMLQLPFDSDVGLDVARSLQAIVAHKDVDGLGPTNTALLSRENVLCPACESQRVHIPCTAAACFALINYAKFPLKGSHCVVIGRGRLVGAPTADLLVGPGCATVTQCHIYSRNLAEVVVHADVVVAAAGCPGLVQGEWIKPGALVLDCGYNVFPDPTDPTRTISVGDVRFDEARSRAGWITPVPGGVGPVTIAMLFRNTLNSARWSVGLGSVLCHCANAFSQMNAATGSSPVAEL